MDPTTALRLHVNDIRRVVRALEVFELTGQPISSFQTQWTKPVSTDHRPLATGHLCCLDLPREELYSRIDRRVESRIAAGWLEEVRLFRQNMLSREAGRALGYNELGQVLEGKLPLPDAVALIQQRSRQFAKRQLTWFRNWPGLTWVRPELTLLLQALTIEVDEAG